LIHQGVRFGNNTAFI